MNEGLTRLSRGFHGAAFTRPTWANAAGSVLRTLPMQQKMTKRQFRGTVHQLVKQLSHSLHSQIVMLPKFP